MKTAFELAMERLNKNQPPPSQLSEDQKKQLAEIDAKFKAKIAENELFLEREIAKARTTGDFEALQQLSRQLANDRKNLEAERDTQKDAVRAQTPPA